MGKGRNHFDKKTMSNVEGLCINKINDSFKHFSFLGQAKVDCAGMKESENEINGK